MTDGRVCPGNLARFRPGVFRAGLAVVAVAALAGACARDAGREAGAGIADGRTAYVSNGCAACHGPDGHGDGMLAPAMSPAPTDFHDPKGFETARTVDDLAAVIERGVPATPSPMPAYAHLDIEDRRAIATYILSLGDALASPVRIQDAWARAPLGTSARMAAYAVIVNDSAAPVTLVSAESSMAEAVEFHEMSMEDSFMRMRRVAEVVVPAKERIVFEPSGRHLMVLGVKGKPEPGDHLPLVIATGDGRALHVDVPVRTGEPGS